MRHENHYKCKKRDTKQHTLLVSRGDVCDKVVLKQRSRVRAHAKLEIALRAKGGVRCYGDSEGVAEVNKTLLGQVGM